MLFYLVIHVSLRNVTEYDVTSPCARQCYSILYVPLRYTKCYILSADIQVTGTEYVERGSTIELICNATGKPEPPHDVEWFKGGAKINSDAANGVIITKKIETKVLVSILVIRDSKMADSGEFTCRSSNQESETIKVHVLNGTTATPSHAHLHVLHELVSYLGDA